MNFLVFVEAMSGIERLAMQDLSNRDDFKNMSEFHINSAVAMIHAERAECWMDLVDQISVEKPEWVDDDAAR